MIFLLHCLLATISAGAAWGQGLNVYGSVPGLDPSPFYSLQVREASSDTWLEAFTLVTECTAEKFCNTTGIYSHLANWSNSYVNFEMEAGAEVEVKITKLFEDALTRRYEITKAVVHPRQAATSCEVTEAGEAVVTINKPGLFTVDINGQMDDQDTGKLPKERGYYEGPPIHTLTIFANPVLADKPSPEGEGVFAVVPGEAAPSSGPWHTLYFLPGLHDIGSTFTLAANTTYYIPGEAVVYGTMTNKEFYNATGVTIRGHGTLSGDRLPYPSYSDLPEEEHWRMRSVYLHGTEDTRLEGVTIANSAFHAVIIEVKAEWSEPEHYNEVRWVKILGWRGSGDGVNPSVGTVMEDCFIRTQDDSTYVNSPAIRRVVYWQVQYSTIFTEMCSGVLAGQ